jgi:hypothetical protein
MTEHKDCLPENAKRHFIDLRNIRLEAESGKYLARLREFRSQLAARNQPRSGWQEMEEWKYKEEFLDSLATGYLQDAFETCRLYDIPLTRSMCNCLVTATEELLDIQYRHALQAQGLADAKIPASVIQQGNVQSRRIMPRISVMVEAARVEDEKRRLAMAEEKEKSGDTYTQNITQHGGVMNASQTGNVSAQQLTVGELDNLRAALAAMRTFFKKQEESVDTDEYVGLLSSAEKAAAEKDESRMRGYLKQIPGKAWEIGKAVIPASSAALPETSRHGVVVSLSPRSITGPQPEFSPPPRLAQLPHRSAEIVRQRACKWVG